MRLSEHTYRTISAGRGPFLFLGKVMSVPPARAS
jgi:hypothetical protein